MKKILLCFVLVSLVLIPVSAVIHKVGSYETYSDAKTVFVMESIAYIGYQYTELQIIDVSTPSAPQLIGIL